ncbi:MAG: hybrid sensor histidine kinase/response regulator [Caulobacteraceae bacterium]|nr:hybrid sensor histidine kinase/response regulator [Caulobacteraceae bacterium]
MLPSALGLFAACLPAYVWIASKAPNAAWMAVSFAAFAINWGVFYAAIQWLQRDIGVTPARRVRVQTLGAVLWALTVCQIGAFAAGSGPAREPLLALTTAAAGMVMVFAAPVLPTLLIIAPIAAVGPMLAAGAGGREQTSLVWGALALGLALSLVLNRTLRRQFGLVAERDALIGERQAALDEATSLAESKSNLVATLSHEIRNGLSGVIHVLAAAAGAGGRAAPSRAQMTAALGAAQDLISVLNATLDTETAQSGGLDLDVEPFDPLPLARDLVLLSRAQAKAKHVELTFHAENDLASRKTGLIVADPARTRQILSNLIGNAVKYTLRGRIEVRIELRGEGEIEFAVADTGPGLSPEELTLAFEPFQRVARTGAGVPGAGLGLSLSRELAGLMGGRIEAKSAVGAGSCFSLVLPYNPTAPMEVRDLQPTAMEESRRPLRVLMAEDDSLSAAMMRAILEQLGHQVVHAHNGKRAVELCGVCDFDLLMFDGRMPGLDGAAAIREVRAMNSPNAQAPIIAVIGGEADEAQQCLAAGANAVLRKPLSVNGLARAVADAMAQAPTSTGALQARA